MAEILVAEDDDDMRELLTEILTSAGHEVRQVADGSTALRAVRADVPDLALLDYRMGSPDGLEVCRQIKADPRYAHVPVLILTAEGDVEDRIRGFGAGANDYLPKPFDPRELLARVGALLRLSEQGRELNPTTGLPGPPAIAKEFERRRASGQSFTLAYLDLDDFKSFNDHFGFPVANGLVEALGRIVDSAADENGAFAGHIGGDDFVVLGEHGRVRELTEQVQREFSEAVRSAVPAEVAQRGSYTGRLRDGGIGEVPLSRVTAVLVNVTAGSAPMLERLGEVAAEYKGVAKDSTPGGIVEVEI